MSSSVFLTQLAGERNPFVHEQCNKFDSTRYDLIKKWKEKKKDQKRMSNEERRQSRQDEETRNEILKENARELHAIFSVVCHNVTSR